MSHLKAKIMNALNSIPLRLSVSLFVRSSVRLCLRWSLILNETALSAKNYHVWNSFTREYDITCE